MIMIILLLYFWGKYKYCCLVVDRLTLKLYNNYEHMFLKIMAMGYGLWARGHGLWGFEHTFEVRLTPIAYCQSPIALQLCWNMI